MYKDRTPNSQKTITPTASDEVFKEVKIKIKYVCILLI
jgi:hypothetical protein